MWFSVAILLLLLLFSETVTEFWLKSFLLFTTEKGRKIGGTRWGKCLVLTRLWKNIEYLFSGEVLRFLDSGTSSSSKLFLFGLCLPQMNEWIASFKDIKENCLDRIKFVVNNEIEIRFNVKLSILNLFVTAQKFCSISK